LYEFGPFRIDTQKRLLLRDNQPVSLTPKAFDILLLLVQQGDRLVSKDELMKAVWPDSFVEESNLSQNIFTLRKALGDSIEARRYIVTVPGRGYQFAEKVLAVGEERQEELTVASPPNPPGVMEAAKSRAIWLWLGASVVAVAALIGGILSFRSQPTPLTDKDTLLLADFGNTTGDPVFDETLKQGLLIQLAQSPFLAFVSEHRVNETLKLMGRSAGERLTPEVAREVCLRTGSKAMLSGSITHLGSQYVISLKAENCNSGDILAVSQEQATRKEDVLKALDAIAVNLRRKLGESLATLEERDVPLEQATTPSLEALKAYSLGYRQANSGALLDAIPFYQRAIELDPDFAVAYAHLGQTYANSSQEALAVASIKQAFARRERASEREKFYIITRYYELVTKEVDRRVEVFELWKRMYPRDSIPLNDLAAEHVDMGRFDQSLVEAQAAISLSPIGYTAYSLLGMSYLGLNRFDEAKAVREKQVKEGLADHWDHVDLYGIAVLQDDAAAAQREIDWSQGKPYEFFMLQTMAGLAASKGKLEDAMETYRLAMEKARHAGFAGIATNTVVDTVLMRTLVGNASGGTLSPAESERARRTAGSIYAMRGDTRRASAIADELVKLVPTATYVNRVWAPSIRAEIEISRGNPAKAIELLEAASPYEFGWKAGLWPTYVRGRAFLRARRGKEAAAEFERILQHRGTCFADSLSPLVYTLSYLQLGRAQVLAGETPLARRSYENFLAAWKDADPDIPILKQAKAEYANLR
jgi:DNA-binding winged helix-turn-helix (wHTH) protein/tetratricopeptide (TPR) repeat protein